MKDNKSASLFQKEQVIESLKQSFVKLNPRMMIKNPIMFTVEVATAVMFFVTLYSIVNASQGSFGYNIAVFVILFVTLLFANFAGERRYHFSSLKYFEKELGLSQKKELEEEGMLRDNVKKYYLEQDYNCAETILRCIDEEYGIGLTEDDFKLVSAFGGGMGCGSSCGALCGAMAALGRLTVKTRAHATEGFKDTCADLVDEFRKKLGNTDCSELVKIYKKDDVRCLETVCLAADVFEEFYKKNIAR